MNSPEVDRQLLYRHVAELHAANLDQGFLGTLGVPFLALMYQAIDEEPGCFLIVARRDGRIVGFIAGAMAMRPVYRRMLRRWARLAVALLPSSIRPRRVLRIFEILRYNRGAHASVHGPVAELLSLAVDPAYRGKQIAETLYLELCGAFASRGVDEFRIVVGAVLAPAHRFYQRMGAEPVGVLEVHKGASSTVYAHRIRP